MCDQAANDRPATPNKSGRMSKPRSREAEKGYCSKCKTVKATIAVRQSIFCKACFLTGTEAKFRTAMSKLRPSTPPRTAGPASGESSGPSGVLALSGGCCSVALLHLLAMLIEQDRSRPHAVPQIASLSVVFIDESEIIPCDPTYYPRLEALVRQCRIPLRTVKLSTAFDLNAAGRTLVVENTTVSSTVPNPTKSSLDRLRAVFDSSPSTSAKEDLLDSIRTHLLLHAAKDATYLFLGSSTTTLANRVIAATAKGKGASIPRFLAPTSTPLGTASPTVLKPLATFTAKELGLFTYFRALDVIPFPTLTSARPPGLKVSVHHITQTFLAKLEATQEGTVSAVYRTAAKLRAPPTDAPLCPLCLECPLEPADVAAGSRHGATTAGHVAMVCWGCGTVLDELQRRDRRGARGPVEVPLFDQIAEYLLSDDDE
ncbi:Cytoplasmic tRNA 2-thiolation protein 2 [Allomyces javanicus]|nr:Cytoplasmic tRNA 2-thiolation protein 2 [Allomyces javanicus]